MEHLALRRVADQLVHHGLYPRGGLLDDVPLGGGRERNLQARLEPVQAMEGQAAAVLQQRDHARRRRVVLRRADAVGHRGREDLPTQIAPQLLQLVHRGRDRRLPDEPHQHPRGARIELALGTAGAAIPGLEGRVGDGHPAGARIRAGPMPAMAVALARRLGAIVPVGVRPARPAVEADALQDLPRLLGRRAEEELPQPGDRRRVVLQQGGQVPEGVHERLQRPGVLLRERGARPVQQGIEVGRGEVDPGAGGRHPSRPPAAAESAA